MKNLTQLLTAVLIILIVGFKGDNLPVLFSNRLSRAQMTFTPPDQYKEVSVKSNDQMHYEYALKHPDKNFEIRYAVTPLDSIFLQYNALEKNKNPGDVNLNPNKLYYGAFLAIMAIMANISGGKPPKVELYPNDAVKNEFNADWGAFGLCEVRGEFGKGYKYCMAVAIHKDNLANAYYFYLTDNAADFQALLPLVFHTLKFK